MAQEVQEKIKEPPKDKLYEQFPIRKKYRVASPTTEPYEATDKTTYGGDQ